VGTWLSRLVQILSSTIRVLERSGIRRGILLREKPISPDGEDDFTTLERRRRFRPSTRL